MTEIGKNLRIDFVLGSFAISMIGFHKIVCDFISSSQSNIYDNKKKCDEDII